MRTPCRICQKPSVAHKLCNAHYFAFLHHGDPLIRLNARCMPFDQRYTVDPQTQCWMWNNQKSRYGYWKAHGEIKAHRASWVLHNGKIPDGLLVLHRCDHPKCVNPEHLFLGTQPENMEDMRGKGRGRNSVGEANSTAKLTIPQVEAIQMDLRPTKIICAEYGLNPTTVTNIQRGKLWPHLFNEAVKANRLAAKYLCVVFPHTVF